MPSCTHGFQALTDTADVSNASDDPELAIPSPLPEPDPRGSGAGGAAGAPGAGPRPPARTATMATIYETGPRWH
jgi:hypothetical protein